ncbi:MAG TPA: FAD-dependent oxidoreductase, partial [Candidatus Acidoferrum sp.]|nr:FAD-dependent oxidoreductase [Candidatus Acidoferrum sp.]
HAGMRAVLAAPVDSRLFFAGEATSPNFFSTAHGAKDSGERAAREVMGALVDAKLGPAGTSLLPSRTDHLR